MGLVSPAGQPPAPRGLHAVSPLRKLFFGRPTPTERQEHSRLPKILALPVFASDAISSVAYATQQILLALGAAGLWTLQNRDLYTGLTLGITGAIVFLLVVVATSYWQTIFAYPSGGGSYIVSKENLGTAAGLIAGAALLIDYVLTVAVSIASGVQNLLSTPVMAPWSHDLVPFCLLFIVILTLANLRGLKESGTMFAIPTYLFVGMAGLMIALGIAGHYTPLDQVLPAEDRSIPPQAFHADSLLGLALVGLVLRGFANGCSAMTGVEAVSNGIPAFRKPESRNAALTLLAMACILGAVFLGISWLAVKLHVIYWEHGKHTATPVIDQLSSSIFGKGSALYYAMQLATTAILVLAANTSYADFPRLGSIMARDGFLPRQLSNLGDKLVYSNGIVLLGLFASLLIVVFHGKVDDLIPLYAVGVFTAFTLSQSGMVKHWRSERSRGWAGKATVNGIGAVCTGVVLLDIIYEKGPEGAWVVIVLVGILYWLFRVIHRHYASLRAALSMESYQPPAAPVSNTVLVMVPSIHRGIMPALDYGRSIAGDVRAVNIETDESRTPRLKELWERWGDDVPLVVLPSPYRSVVGPLLAYLDEVDRERPNTRVTVVVPESVTGKWWHSLLHANYGAWIKLYLLGRKNVIVANVRYFVDEGAEQSASSDPSRALSPDTPGAIPPAPRRKAQAEAAPEEAAGASAAHANEP
jgi:amino acid transporter